eukprot:205565-Chlamydomonas_euryale.AAC.2
MDLERYMPASWGVVVCARARARRCGSSAEDDLLVVFAVLQSVRPTVARKTTRGSQPQHAVAGLSRFLKRCAASARLYPHLQANALPHPSPTR